MGSNWSLTSVLLIIGIFFALLTIVLSSINVENPYTGLKSSIVSLMFDSIFGNDESGQVIEPASITLNGTGNITVTWPILPTAIP